jgi:hypothetical protein
MCVEVAMVLSDLHFLIRMLHLQIDPSGTVPRHIGHVFQKSMLGYG